MWPNFGKSILSMKEFILALILYKFDYNKMYLRSGFSSSWII